MELRALTAARQFVTNTQTPDKHWLAGCGQSSSVWQTIGVQSSLRLYEAPASVWQHDAQFPIVEMPASGQPDTTHQHGVA